MPGVTAPAVQQALVQHAERLKHRFAVLDGPKHADRAEIRAHRGHYDSRHAALYHPWLAVPHPETGDDVLVPPSGSVVGIYARTDRARGVWKAPANQAVRNATGLERDLNRCQQEELNPLGINVVRDFGPDRRGIRVWGARTVSSDSEWRYVNVRRAFMFIEHSITKGTEWVVFEPNDERLWATVRATISDFLVEMWRAGALLGPTREDAFFVKCDRSTMSASDLDQGRLVCEVGVARTRPAEFEIFRVNQVTAVARA
jgi:phage tail sheath protein FI